MFDGIVMMDTRYCWRMDYNVGDGCMCDIRPERGLVLGIIHTRLQLV